MKILAAVDLDEFALEVVARAAEIASATGAEALSVIHVESIPARYAKLPVESGAKVTVEQREIEASAHRLRQLLDRVHGGRSLTTHPSVVAGDPPVEIVAEAVRGKFDMIVLGTHRRSGVSRILFGSVAEQVIRHSSCPVLVVPIVSPSERST